MDLLPKYDRWIKEAKARGTICFTPAELRIMRGALTDWRSLAVELADPLAVLVDERYEAMRPLALERARAALSKARDAGLLGETDG